MQMDSMFDTMEFVLLLGCGVYCIYLFFTLRGLKKVPENKLLIPSSKTPSQCSDPVGYLGQMRPKLLTLGILLVIFSLILLADSELHWNNTALEVCLLVLPLLSLGWFVSEFHKAIKQYW